MIFFNTKNVNKQKIVYVISCDSNRSNLYPWNIHNVLTWDLKMHRFQIHMHIELNTNTTSTRILLKIIWYIDQIICRVASRKTIANSVINPKNIVVCWKMGRIKRKKNEKIIKLRSVFCPAPTYLSQLRFKLPPSSCRIWYLIWLSIKQRHFLQYFENKVYVCSHDIFTYDCQKVC